MHNGLDREHKAEIKADGRIKEYAHRLMTIAMDRGCKRLSIFMQQLRSQRIFSLCNRDAVLLQMGNFCAKISCQAIFMSM